MKKSLRQEIEEAEANANHLADLYAKAKPSKMRRNGRGGVLSVTWADGLQHDFDYLSLREIAEESVTAARPAE